MEAARRRIAQLQAQLDSNRDDLQKTTVFSPMDGVVTSLQKEEGEVVIGAQSFHPTVIMTVADLSVMECEILVDETDIRNLTLGQAAEVRVDALEGVKIKGEVTEIGSSAIPRGTAGATARPAAAATPATRPRTSRSRSRSKDPPPSLRPGLNATADITTATRKTSVLAVAHPGRGGARGGRGGQGRGSRRRPRPRPADEQHRRRPREPAKGEEKDGRVRGGGGQVRVPAGEDRDHGRDGHRGRWRGCRKARRS